MNRDFLAAAVLTLIASLLPDVVVREWLGLQLTWLHFTKLVVLLVASAVFAGRKGLRHLSQYAIVLAAFVGVQMISGRLSSWWQATPEVYSFTRTFGGAILAKSVGAMLLAGVLLILFGSREKVFLVKGDLTVKAERIGWLGIDQGKISWGKLSLISAILISFGTLLLTILTVTGISVQNKSDLVRFLPMIVLLALVNSVSEGIIFRSAILGSLRSFLNKDQAVLIAAAIFGVAHFYGAPSGVLGVAMSGLLGWYLSRSMYETRGFVSSWIIHFMQDVVIFSTIGVMAGFR